MHQNDTGRPEHQAVTDDLTALRHRHPEHWSFCSTWAGEGPDRRRVLVGRHDEGALVSGADLDAIERKIALVDAS